VTGEDGRLIGIITDRDVCMATYTKAKAPQAIRVAEAMARQVFSVQADEELDTVEHLMSDKQVRRVPVVDAANRPIGIVSLNDLAHHAVVGREKKGLERAVAQTLAAICRPRASAKAPSS
jgi:predicted transcriptional regulator